MHSAGSWPTKEDAETFNLPTEAELSGDFSHSILAQNIYDPTTTMQTANEMGSTSLEAPVLADYIPSR